MLVENDVVLICINAGVYPCDREVRCCLGCWRGYHEFVCADSGFGFFASNQAGYTVHGVKIFGWAAFPVSQ